MENGRAKITWRHEYCLVQWQHRPALRYRNTHPVPAPFGGLFIKSVGSASRRPPAPQWRLVLAREAPVQASQLCNRFQEKGHRKNAGIELERRRRRSFSHAALAGENVSHHVRFHMLKIKSRKILLIIVNNRVTQLKRYADVLGINMCV